MQIYVLGCGAVLEAGEGIPGHILACKTECKHACYGCVHANTSVRKHNNRYGRMR